MRIVLLVLCALTAFIGAVSEVRAGPMYKCVINGSVTYQQAPCPSTQARRDPTLEELNAAEKKRRAAAVSAAPREATAAPATTSSGFSCDGRKYCTQMRSCAEAKYFLASCPGVKMDGDNDGIPCEEQWCRP
jgi:hypothetical protein